MNRKRAETTSKWMIGMLSSLLLLWGVLTGLAQAQVQTPACQGLVFSTEEDFLSQGPKPPDGNPIISDGDLLVWNIPGPGVGVCARNRDLLRVFEIRVDLGLDAVDVIDLDRRLIVFSTELDDPKGRFTAGDLLATNGAVLPNSALLALFNLPEPEDIGLDALQLVGDTRAIVRLLETIRVRGRSYWAENSIRLVAALKELQVDIWFSTEGTGPFPEKPSFLDGDLLSARDGTIVAPNAILLPPSVPAGIPNRGVDFGLDAVSADRRGNRRSIHFSTEILYEGRPSFTDGDVLRFGDGVVITNATLVAPFEPKANFLGLDALSFPVNSPPQDPNIQTMCGDRPVADFDGGLVSTGGSGSGLYHANLATSPPGDPPRRPCGEFVPIDGFLPSSGVNRFRVAYRSDGTPAPAIDTALGIRTNWVLYEWNSIFGFCLPTGSLSTDAAGWMDAADYLAAKLGTLTGCANSGLRLAVWDTNNRLGLGPTNKDGHYVLWLEWEDSGGTLHREPVEHHLQLDNTLPTIAPYPDGLQVRLKDGSTIVPACGEAPVGASEFQVWGQFADDYYWNFRLVVRGGVPPASVGYGPHNYYDLNDGTPGVKNTDDTGTTPDGSTVHLRNIDMTDLGDSFVACCYLLDLWVRDAAIRHSFNGRVANDVSGSSAWQAHAFVTFAAAPAP